MSDTERLIEGAGRLLGGLRGVRWDNLPACDPRDLFALDAGGAGPLHVATIHAGEDETLFVKESPRLVADLVTALRAERERADKATLEALELKQRGRSLELVSADAIRERDELAAGLRSANALYETCKIDRDRYAAANLAANKRIVELEHERDEARSKLSRLTTPRPIAEAPRESGKQIIALWMHGDVVESMDVVCWADMDMDGDHPERKFWMNTAGDSVEGMTHFLPLPAEGGQR